MGDKEIDQMAVIVDYFDKDGAAAEQQPAQEDIADQQAVAEEQADIVDDIPRPDDSASQNAGPTQSEMSKMTGRTYISQL